ncbi:MAG: T9SS type A sorting domain-containing protein [Ignavibacteria bacterium]|nr:T9SS type A sorting domain-containing protein [Ignavibacteria bacterium]
MKNNFILTLLFIVCLSAASFAQLDSVYYLGPAAGNVPSGVTVTLNPMTFDEPISGDPIEIKDLEGPSINGNLENYDPSNLPPYVYTEDKLIKSVNKGTTAQTVILDKWDGIAMTNSIPPDPIMAVGPDHVIACVNSAFRVWDKQGNLLASVNADSWISPVIGSGAFDPQIIYDHYANRWFMLWDWQDSPSQQGWFIISYSDNADPFGTWYMYKMDAKLNGTANSGTWGDFPQIGYDDQAIYINSRSFSWAGYYQYNKIRILDKSVLYASNGGVLPFVDLWSIGRPNVPSDKPDVLEPAICYTPGQGGYFFNTLQNGGVYTIMYKLLNPTSPTPRLRGKTLVVNSYGNAPLAQQLGGGTGIESGGSKHRHSPIVRDNYLYAAHSIANTTNASYSSVRYYKVDLSNASISEQAELGMIGYYYLYPALAIDKDHNILVTFSRSATTEYVGAFVSSKYAADPPGLNPSLILQPGLGNYVVDFGSGRNRWGDYMGIYLDPVNEYDVWTFTEYVRSTNTWGTYVGRILMAAFPGAHAYAESFNVDFGNAQVGATPSTKTVILTNYGQADLVISAINSPVGPFSLLTNLSLPYTLAPYDSVDLDFEFDPANPIVYDELISFTSNDPDFPGFRLKGRGFEINPAVSDILYAVSSAADTGKTFWIDRATGLGTEIGPSNFPSINTATIDPVTNTIYGVIPGTTESDLVKINATGGDAYIIHTLNLGFLVAVACDTNGTVYAGTQAGGIYTVDVNTGVYTQVTTASIQLMSLAFNPLTNELWASSKVAIGQKDKIYKIDLTTGSAILIGETDFNVPTNDLAFDEAGVLFGVIGSPTENGRIIIIDTSTGLGTLLGDTGFQDVRALAYTVNNPTSVDDNNNSLPESFYLAQNYPNPFNPSTKISFRIAEPGIVSLKVFDILGNEVMSLVDEQKPAGLYEVKFDASSLTSGVYFYQLKSGNLVQTKKMVLLK